jgi:hypothetical protein
LDAAQIVKAYVELHGPDLETYRRVYSDPANRKGMLYSLAREAPPGFGRPFFSHESEVRAIDVLLLGSQEQIDAYLRLAEGVEYE